MHVGGYAVLVQAALHALQPAAVDGEDRPAAAGLADQGRYATANPGDAGHLGQAFAVQANRQGVGQLRDVRTAGTGIDQRKVMGGHLNPPGRRDAARFHSQ
ncbi:hypothetical protein D3C84_1111930 [compost metagenome]